MQYWLLKSEPNVWSINQQKKMGTKGAIWDGVRNFQARNNLKKMKNGDLCFFYHSNIGKEIVGIVEVIKEFYLDKTDKSGRFVAVTVQFKKKLPKPITLENIKKNKKLFLYEFYIILFNNPMINDAPNADGSAILPQKVKVSAKEFSAKFSSKRECYSFLTLYCKAFLPDYQCITIYHVSY